MNETIRNVLRTAAGLAALLTAGCAGTPGAPVTPETSRPTPVTVRHLDTRTVAAADLPVPRTLHFRDRSGAPSETTAAMARKTAGIVAQRGFTVAADAPNVLVEIRTTATPADKMGTSRVYGGAADVDVFFRGDAGSGGARLLGSERFECRGDRKFDDTEAVNSLTDHLAQRVANWLAPLVAAEGMGMTDTRFRAEQAFRELDAEIERMGGN